MALIKVVMDFNVVNWANHKINSLQQNPAIQYVVCSINLVATVLDHVVYVHHFITGNLQPQQPYCEDLINLFDPLNIGM